MSAKSKSNLPVLGDAPTASTVAAFLTGVADGLASGKIAPGVARELVSAAKAAVVALRAARVGGWRRFG